MNPPELHELIRDRDIENWSQAEREILAELQATRRHAVIIRVSNLQYIGEYHPHLSFGYTPGEFTPGTPVPVRFQDQKMFVRRPNGVELETTIVHKIG